MTDASAISGLVEELDRVEVRFIPGLHAKVYVADEVEAIVTSANMTFRGLRENLEYGVVVKGKATLRKVRADLHAYALLGSQVGLAELRVLRDVAAELSELRRRLEKTLERRLSREFEWRVAEADEKILRIRVGGRSAHAIFCDAILHVLKDGPRRTAEMHGDIRRLLPDLCDDQVDRVIDGERFGKKWKHAVRSAQQHLKRRGLASYESGFWSLVGTTQPDD